MIENKILICKDFNVFDDPKVNFCGVYMAVGNFVSESIKRPIYIGSSKQIRRRIRDHNKYLKAGRHENSIFQRLYNKYGNNFTWILLETCEVGEEKVREQYYLDTVRPFASENGNGMNISKLAEGCSGGRAPGFKNTKEHNDNISKAKMGVSREPFTQEWKDKISEMTRRTAPERSKKLKENTKNSDKLRLLAESQKKECELISPEGVLIKIRGVNQWCKENNLNTAAIFKVLNEIHGQIVEHM